MTVQKIFFDGKNRGMIVAVTTDGSKYEQKQEHCAACDGIASVLTPLEGAANGARKCGCATSH